MKVDKAISGLFEESNLHITRRKLVFWSQNYYLKVIKTITRKKNILDSVCLYAAISLRLRRSLNSSCMPRIR